jgi:hypothetical protein
MLLGRGFMGGGYGRGYGRGCVEEAEGFSLLVSEIKLWNEAEFVPTNFLPERKRKDIYKTEASLLITLYPTC